MTAVVELASRLFGMAIANIVLLGTPIALLLWADVPGGREISFFIAGVAWASIYDSGKEIIQSARESAQTQQHKG